MPTSIYVSTFLSSILSLFYSIDMPSRHINLFTQVWHGWSRDASACRSESSDLRRIEVAIKCAEEGWEQRRQTMAAQLVQRFATNTYKLTNTCVANHGIGLAAAFVHLRKDQQAVSVLRGTSYDPSASTCFPPYNYTSHGYTHMYTHTIYNATPSRLPPLPGTDMTQASPP